MLIIGESDDHILINTNDGYAYMQKKEPTTSSDDALTTQERVILLLVREVKRLEEKIDRHADMVRKELVGYWPGEDITLERLLDNIKNDNS